MCHKAKFDYRDITVGNVIDGNITITCDYCYKDNNNLYVNVDIQSWQLDASYTMHQFTCIYCEHRNMMLTYQK